MRVQKGMTLVEVLVALMLVALLSIGLFSAFRIGQRTYGQVTRNLATTSELMTAHKLVRRIVESAYPLDSDTVQPRYGLEGTETELALTAPAPGYNEAGYYRYYLFTKTRRDGLKDLIVRYGIDRNGVMLSARGESGTPVQQEALLVGIREVAFRYLTPTEVGADGASIVDSEWISRWQQARLPALVQMIVHFPANDSRHWPALFALPQVTANAHCEFDVVAQNCRGGRP